MKVLPPSDRAKRCPECLGYGEVRDHPYCGGYVESPRPAKEPSPNEIV